MSRMTGIDDTKVYEISKRTEELKRTIRSIDSRGVRRSIREDLIREHFLASIDESLPLDRARAFAHVPADAAPVVYGHEMIMGSLLRRATSSSVP